MNYTKYLVVGGLCAMAMTGASQAATITVTGDQNLTNKVNRITSSQTWTSDNEYLLDGLITVGSGVTLTIRPGTVVRGLNALTTGSDYRPGTLIVEKGGKLIANGTPENPIVFTDQWDDHFPWKTGNTGTTQERPYKYQFNTASSKTWQTKTNSYDYGSIGNLHGMWGGIVLCGKAFLNFNDSQIGSATIVVEGTDAGLGLNGGGNDDNDSSGELSYIQIRYGGSVLANGSEINGLTMYGVGRGTKLHHIEVYNNQDDMFEYFGGCVNGKYLVAWGAGDDLFDSDNGYRGKNQFLFGVQRDMEGGKIESGASDKGLEMDGGESKINSMSQLFSASVWANITLIGNQFAAVATPADNTRNVAISMRDNASPRIYNSIFMDFSSVATMIENREGDSAWTTANGLVLSPSARFETLSTIANFPTNTYNGGATAGLTADQTRAYFYGDGVLTDVYQACIRGCYFWNFNTNNTASSSSGLYPSVTGSVWSATYPWTSSDLGKGPWVSGASNTAYQDFDLPNERNNDWSSKNTEAFTLTANGSNQMPIQYRHRVQKTRYSTTSLDLLHVDPRAANEAIVSATAVPDQWLTPVRFQGAFAPDSNWAKGWTTIGTLKSTNAANATIYGVFGATNVVDSLVVEGDVTTGGTVSYPANIVITNTLNTVTTVGVNGIVYESNGSTIADTGLNGVTAGALQTSPVITYSITAPGTYQLQMTDDLTPIPIIWTPVKTFTVNAASVLSPVTVNLTDIIGSTPPNSGDSRFYKLLK